MPGVENSLWSCCPPLGRSLGHIGHTRHQDAIIAQNIAKKNLDFRKRAQKSAKLSGGVIRQRVFFEHRRKKDSTKRGKCKEKSSGVARIWMFFIIGGQRHVGKFYLLSYFKAVARIRSAKGIISSSFSMSSFASLFSPSNSPTLHCFPLKYRRHRGLSLLSSRRMEQ